MWRFDKVVVRLARRACSNDRNRLWRIFGCAAALLVGGIVSAQAAIPPSQRAVLENIYAQTDGVHWDNQQGWGGAPGTECNWPGVTCNSAGTSVIGLDFSNKGLYGVLPSLDGLPDLQSFVVRQVADSGIGPFNWLFGNIPPLHGLKKLKTFILHNTDVSGDVPSLANMPALEHFECSNCALNGHLGSLHGDMHLEYFEVTGFDLGGNPSGNLPSLAGLSRLQYFRVMGDFTGELPDLTGLTQLQTFVVIGYRLTGGLPDLVDLPNLQTFTVHGFVSGPFGRFLNLPELQEFDASDNLLSGSIPSLSGAPNLKHFYVRGNRLTGAFPVLGGLGALQYIDVAYNHIEGALPAPSEAFVERAAAETRIDGLCPNLLTPASDPPSQVDLDWNAITKATPWSKDCVPDPLWKTTIMTRSSRNPSLGDEPVTFTTVVHGIDPTGTVRFTALQDAPGAATITLCDSVPLVDEVASCTSNKLPVSPATYTIFASYSGDEHNASATTMRYPNSTISDLYQSVLEKITEHTSDPQAQVGQTVDLSLSYSQGAPDDKVNFYAGRAGNNPLCTDVPVHAAPEGGFIAHCTTQFDSAEPRLLTATRKPNHGYPDAEPIIQQVSAAQAFDADQFALGGPWYNPATTGQGLQLTVYPDHNGDGLAMLAGAWFTFDHDGHQRWLAFQGDEMQAHGASFKVGLLAPAGGNFNAGPGTTPAPEVGSAVLTFYDCGHAALEYQLDDGRKGTIAYQRIDQPTACSSAVPAPPFVSGAGNRPAHYNDVLHGGAWYNQATSGQGLYIDLVPAQMAFVATWFTYAPQGSAGAGVDRQRWFLMASTGYTPGDLSLHDLQIMQVTGGSFDQPGGIDAQAVGTADIDFHSCTSMTLNYRFDKGEFSGLSGSIDESPIAGNPACEDAQPAGAH